MFTNSTSSEQIERELQTVIAGLSKAAQFLNNDQNNSLLSAMIAKLNEIEEAVPDSRGITPLSGGRPLT